MPLRRRLAIACASAVALVILLASIVVYMVVRDQLLGQVDSELQSQAGLVSQLRHAPSTAFRRRPGAAGGGAPIWQVTTGAGNVVCSDGNVPLPFDRRVQSIASGNGGAGPYLDDVNVGGSRAARADRAGQRG